MNPVRIVEFLEFIQDRDEKFLEATDTAATICCECGKNTPVGRHPFWHRYARSLCDNCGRQYETFLAALCK